MNSGDIGLQIRIRSSADMGGVNEATQSMTDLGTSSRELTGGLSSTMRVSREFDMVLRGMESGSMRGMLMSMRGLGMMAHQLGPAFLEVGGAAAGFAAPVILALKLMGDQTKQLQADIAAMYAEGKKGAETYKQELDRLNEANKKAADDLKSDFDTLKKGIEDHDKAVAQAKERADALNKAYDERAKAELERDKQVALSKAVTPEDEAKVNLTFKLQEEQLANQQKINALVSTKLAADIAIADVAKNERDLDAAHLDQVHKLTESRVDKEQKIAAAGDVFRTEGAGAEAPSKWSQMSALDRLIMTAKSQLPGSGVSEVDVQAAQQPGGFQSNAALIDAQKKAAAAVEADKALQKRIASDQEGETTGVGETKRKAQLDLEKLTDEARAELATLTGERAAHQTEIRKATAPLAAAASAAAQKVSLDQEALDALKEKAEKSQDIGAFAKEISDATRTLAADTAAADAAQAKYQGTLDSMNASAKHSEQSLVTQTTLLKQLIDEVIKVKEGILRRPSDYGGAPAAAGGKGATRPLADALGQFFDALDETDSSMVHAVQTASRNQQDTDRAIRDINNG